MALLFTDGVGIGRADPAVNPLARGEFLLSRFEGGAGAPLPMGGTAHPVDATFGVPGRHNKEGLVVVAETKTTDSEPLRREVQHRVRDAVGLPVREVVLVAPGSLPKTSSGKLQRSLCKVRYLGQELQAV